MLLSTMLKEIAETTEVAVLKKLQEAITAQMAKIIKAKQESVGTSDVFKPVEGHPTNEPFPRIKK